MGESGASDIEDSILPAPHLDDVQFGLYRTLKVRDIFRVSQGVGRSNPGIDS